MSTPAISVVICTFRPRPAYLARALAGLRSQALALSDWELVIVDNGSPEPVASHADISWHPSARIVTEAEVGLTAARLRGIAETKAPVLVFVDDDNILAPDYLDRALARASAWPMLGVWGCGSITPEWEKAPPPDFAPYIAYLAVHRAPGDRWSNHQFDYWTIPIGAGMCVRSPVARRYADKVRNDPRRKLLGRTGENLAGCEDFDIAMTAIEMGFGTGIFTDLALTHLMPAGRVEEAYLLRLVEGHACSTVILHALYGRPCPAAPSGIMGRLRELRLRRSLDSIGARIHGARRRGETRAREILRRIAL